MPNLSNAATVPALCAAGTVSAYALLAQGYAPITFEGTSTSSTLAAGELAPKEVYRWTVSAEQLQEKLQHLHHIQVRPPSPGGAVPYAPAPCLCCSCGNPWLEGRVNMAFEHGI